MSAQPATTQQLADYLVTGFWADNGSGSPAFDTSASNVVTASVGGVTDAAAALARNALEVWELVADIDVVEVAGAAMIVFDDAAPGAYTDWAGPVAVVNVGPDWLEDYGTSARGYSGMSYIHEVGHALGLGHAGPYNGSASWSQARFQNDSWQMSVMSYFSQPENPYTSATYAMCATPMMADIVAIQAIYGAQTGGPAGGDTTWGIGSSLGIALDALFAGPSAGLRDLAMTVYDPSGHDLLDFSNDTLAQTVDLRGGAFSSVYGEKGNLGIMAGTVIEDFRAGSGSDRVTGNAAANALWLGAGNDTASGMEGDDLVDGGAGNDTLSGNDGADTLLGGAGADRLDGGAGDDWLDGGAGGDRFAGGAGRDTVSFASAAASVRMSLDRSVSGTGDAYGDTYGSDIEDIVGSGYADRLRGNSLANVILGGAGDDTLEGRAGNDTLWGGDGADRLYGGAGADELRGGGDADTFVFLSASETTLAAPDVIEDFEVGVDRLDLVRIDANTGRTGNQAFVLDTGGTFAAGEIRQEVVDGNLVLLLNTDSDATVEARIVLVGVTQTLSSLDILL